MNCTQLCINTDGGFSCGCQDGYRLDADGISCTPMVSCEANNTCEEGCIKLNGKVPS